MPELPEVENVCRSLTRMLSGSSRTTNRMTPLRADLRYPFPRGLSAKMRGQKLLTIQRRAKYLLFETERYWLLSHLGMTGSWRQLQESRNHDHLIWEFEGGPTLAFNDPRRFGFVSLFGKNDVIKPISELGPEPLGAEFNSEYLFRATRQSAQPIKSFLLDQKKVAGVGNIYACEALYRAQVRPARHAKRLTKDSCGQVVEAVREVLQKAIDSGGSSIRDYVSADGQKGQFQNLFKVYGRDASPCLLCGKPIRVSRLAGRSTFWCGSCQK